MPTPVSIDLRQKIVVSLKNGSLQRNVAKRFKVSLSTVKRISTKIKHNQDIKPKKPVKTRPRKINYEEVKKFVEENPDKIFKEINRYFCMQNAQYILKILGFTRKKKHFFLLRKEGRR